MERPRKGAIELLSPTKVVIGELLALNEGIEDFDTGILRTPNPYYSTLASGLVRDTVPEEQSG